MPENRSRAPSAPDFFDVAEEMGDRGLFPDPTKARRMTADPHRSRGAALALIVSERERQDELKAAGRFEFTCADDGLTSSEKLACLTEELGEVAREVLTQQGRRLARDTSGTTEGLRKEVVQVAAVALAWTEALVNA